MQVLGLAEGYLLFSLFYALSSAFIFLEAFVLPPLASQAPKFIEGFLGIINGAASEVKSGALSQYSIRCAGAGYVLGGLLFGIAMLHADTCLPALGGRSVCRQGLCCPSCLGRFRTRSTAHSQFPWESLWSGWAMRSGLNGAVKRHSPLQAPRNLRLGPNMTK